MDRRKFALKSATGAAMVVLSPTFSIGSSNKARKLRLAFIGVGGRGTGQMRLTLRRDDIVVTALCDIDPLRLNKAADYVEEAGMKKPALYGAGDYDYKNLLKREDVDAVIISTPWIWHTPMSIDAMRAKKAVGCEVAGAFDIEECWALVEAYEETGTPFMVMENVMYRRDIMAVLNMARKGLFGEMIHVEGGYQHDLREVKFNNGDPSQKSGVEFGEKGYSEARWRTGHSVNRNGDLYPTHGLGPIAAFVDNTRGNRFEYLTSMASNARGLHDFIVNHPEGGPDHPNAKIKFRLGDVVTTQIKCANGETILLTHDTNLPRPYSLGFRIQGTKGIWMDINKSIYIEHRSPNKHEWENDEAYMDEFDHPLWKKYEDRATGSGHGGMDFFVLNAFIEALKRNEPMPLDVYDHVSWAAVTCLSEQSIANGGAAVPFPDFTKGKWMNRKPIFGFDDRY